MKHILTGVTVYILVAILSLGGLFGGKQIEEKVPQEEVLEEYKHVLFISSYSYSYLIVEEQLDGIRERFSNQPVFIDVEFMDTKRFNEEENYDSFYNRLRYKLSQESDYDAVIVGDDNGLEFFAEKKDEVFPDIPLFFMGINSYERALSASEQEDITGVLEKQTF